MKCYLFENFQNIINGIIANGHQVRWCSRFENKSYNWQIKSLTWKLTNILKCKETFLFLYCTLCVTNLLYVKSKSEKQKFVVSRIVLLNKTMDTFYFVYQQLLSHLVQNHSSEYIMDKSWLIMEIWNCNI